MRIDPGMGADGGGVGVGVGEGDYVRVERLIYICHLGREARGRGTGEPAVPRGSRAHGSRVEVGDGEGFDMAVVGAHRLGCDVGEVGMAVCEGFEDGGGDADGEGEEVGDAHG